MSICLEGKSCSGKDSVANELCQMGYKRAITYTTRPKRIGEVNDRDYHFISEGTFLNMIKENKFLEYKKYKTKEGIWYYGSCLEDVISGRKVIILTPDGAKKLKEKIPDISLIFLNTSNKEIKKRMKNRMKLSGENKKELKRRYKSDKKDFKKVDADFVIFTDGKTPNNIATTCVVMDYLAKKHNERSDGKYE